MRAELRSFPLLLALVLVAPSLRAADVLSPPVSVTLPESLAVTEGPALEASGVRLVVVPDPVRFVRRSGLSDFPRARAVEVLPRMETGFLEVLRSYATAGRCRVVVRGEGGLPWEFAEALDSIGPCFFEVHVSVDPAPFETPFRVLRPASIVWEAGATLPDAEALARMLRLPQPVLTVDESVLSQALTLTAPLTERGLALRVTTDEGRLSPATRRRLSSNDRPGRVAVVARHGLDPTAARVLRSLPRIQVEIVLDRGLPAGFGEAVAALQRPVDPFDRQAVDEESIDALLAPPSPVDPPGPAAPAAAPARRKKR